MADSQRVGLGERDIDQAITTLKKGSYLLKYGRRGKPKFCPFQLSSDESTLIWYSGKDEKQLKLCQVTKIIPGQRTAIFHRYPRPEKEYQSFSLIYGDRSLDLICKDKDEADVWFVGLKALITHGNYNRKYYSPFFQQDLEAIDGRDSASDLDSNAPNRLGKAFSDIVTYTASINHQNLADSTTSTVSSLTIGSADNIPSGRSSTNETFRVSLSSAVSSSSQGSCQDDFDALGDVFIWGEGSVDGALGCGVHRVGNPSIPKSYALLPKALESTVVLDVYRIACGSNHAALVTRHGEIFSWGQGLGGRLGHGKEVDVPLPTLRVSSNIEATYVSSVSCGPWHTAAVTSSGQLFTFGDGTFGTLGHGDRISTSVPREVESLRGMRVKKVACGLWHTAVVAEEVITDPLSGEVSAGPSSGKLFTWGNGDEGCLGHGDENPRLVPEQVVTLVDENICQVACGHNLTVVLTILGQVYTMGSSTYGQLGCPKANGKLPNLVKGKLSDCIIEEVSCGSYHVAALTSKAEVYTWGKGANGQLGHGDKESRNTPKLVDFLRDKQVKTVVCGSNFTAIICLHKWVGSADHSLCTGCRNQFGFRRKRHNCYNCGLVFCKACSTRKSLKASLAPSTNKPYRVCDDCYYKLKKVLESNHQSSHTPKARTGNNPDKSIDMMEKETVLPRLLSQYSKLSTIDAIHGSKTWQSKHSSKKRLRNSRVFPVITANLQSLELSHFKVPTIAQGSLKKPLQRNLPSSSVCLRTPIIIDDTRNMNVTYSEEIQRLREQVNIVELINFSSFIFINSYAFFN
ncbi:unnamed protein product [Linum tenue]|uniref:FYVE-type domain-containing protein n=1 Tax=Linum tenue TaxID=586396 RepID=A0AAV0IYF4_9ROSI|nr:unnamed protein product [Linum tenue]